MTFLELCQAVARESGTVGTLDEPASVVGQSGRLQRIVHWTREAYLRIQLENRHWRWLQAEFSGDLLIGERTITSGALGISRFREWRYSTETAPCGFTTYDADIGQSDEGHLACYPWRKFHENFMVGGQATTTGKPQAISVTPRDELAVYPLPDKAYKLCGHYQKSSQTLAANADVPEMPADFHVTIQWRALLLMLEYDEAFAQIQFFGNEYGATMEALQRHQLDRFELAGAFA